MFTEKAKNTRDLLTGGSTMQRVMFKSKIHRAKVTGANLHYVGSITIDKELMEKADIIENEKVMVLDIDTGARFETYAVYGERGSREICLNGAAARLVQPGDLVIIISFGMYEERELENFKPVIVHVNEKNVIIGID